MRSYTYDAHGNTDSNGSFVNSFAYTGAVIDEETGLYYLNARYYDPSTGRFISQDSYRGGGESFWHLYAYCDGDPVNYTDLSGHRKTYVFYYHHRKSSKNLNVQARNSFLYDSSSKNVKMISVGTAGQFVYYWNNMDENDVNSIYIYVHGSTGKLHFLDSSISATELDNKLKDKKISGITGLYSCQGGTRVNNKVGTSVAEVFLKKTGKPVFAASNAGVSFAKIFDKYIPVIGKKYIYKKDAGWYQYYYSNGEIKRSFVSFLA